MSTLETTPASRALDSVVAALAAAGITASRDAGAFYPQPVGVLVGLPALVRRTHYGRVFEVAVFVISGDPLNSSTAVDRLFALADDAAAALGTDNYRPSSWRSTVNAEPLPAVELTVTFATPESEV